MNNASPERYGVEIALAGSPPDVITLRSALPPIKGPVRIEGMSWKANSEYVVVDGSGYVAQGPEACPGAVAGQFGANVRTTTTPGLSLVDTTDVEISGLEIRNFCIGVLLNRTRNSFIHDNRIVANHGGAGVMLTGDDGHGTPTATTTIQNRVMRNEFLDNGDGLELTRGAAFNVVADNVFRSTAANPEPSQGIEILRGHDNVVVNNRFEGYSDGIQINWGDRNYIAGNVLRGNTFGLSVTGVGNILDANTITANTVGIAVRPADPSTLVRITRNAVFDNGTRIVRCEAGGSCDPSVQTGATVFGLPGAEHAAYVGSRGGGVKPGADSLLYICPARAPDCQPAPNGGLRPPVITRARPIGTHVEIEGRLDVPAPGHYIIEVFGNSTESVIGGERYIGSAGTVAQRTGAATFSISIELPDRASRPMFFTATVTSPAGATSEFSSPMP